MLASDSAIWLSRVLFQVFAVLLCVEGVSGTTSFAAENRPHSASVEVGPTFLLRKIDGSTSGVRFVRGTPRLTGDVRLTHGETLEFPARPFPLRSSLPVRIVTLWTGEVIPASWKQSGGKKDAVSRFTAQLYSGHSFAESEQSKIDLRDSDIATIRQPVGTSDVCPADSQVRPEGVWQQVERDRAVVPGYVDASAGDFWKRQTVQIPLPDDEPTGHKCLFVVSGRWPASGPEVKSLSPSDRIRSGGTLSIVFVDDRGLRRRIDFSGRGRERLLVLPNGRVKIVNVATERLQIQMLVDRGLTLSSNGVVLASLPDSIGRLDSIEVEGSLVPAIVGEPKGADGLYIQQPLVRVARRNDNAEFARKVASVGRVILNSGDQIYGSIDEVAAAVRLRVSGKGGRRLSVDPKDVSAVSFGRPKTATPWKPVVGEFARIDLVPDVSCSFGGIEEPFWIRTSIQKANHEGLIVQHSLLGKIAIRWEMIRRITPLFAGSYQLLDPGPRHLGNGFRESFNRVEPDGTEMSLSFALDDEQITMPTFLSADIAELIPAGADTLQATPFLNEVRNGFLATQVLLNGELVGTLNQLIKVRPLATDPERVRMLLPATLLKVGENLIHIKQTSAKDDPASFDDCELRAIAVEIEHQQE